MFKIAIFGARSIALGIYTAIKEEYKKCEVSAFLVSDKSQNPDTLAGIPVLELSQYNEKLNTILIATPEDTHAEIVSYLQTNGFYNYICIDSIKEAQIMEHYYTNAGKFISLHSL